MRSVRWIVVLAGASACVCGSGAWLWLRGGGHAREAAAAAPAAVPAAELVPAAPLAVAAESRAPGVPQENDARPARGPSPAADPRQLLLPDGTSTPALNGATHAPPLARGWDPAVPYAPIVGQRTVDGVRWYVHADGTQSTTRMVYRPDLGRLDAVTSVAHPGDGPAAPVRARDQ